MTARGFFPFGPFVCGLGAEKQIASSCDEIMNFYAQVIVFKMFYLFYVPIGFNIFIYYRQSIKAIFRMTTTLILRSNIWQLSFMCIYCI